MLKRTSGIGTLLTKSLDCVCVWFQEAFNNCDSRLRSVYSSAGVNVNSVS